MFIGDPFCLPGLLKGDQPHAVALFERFSLFSGLISYR